MVSAGAGATGAVGSGITETGTGAGASTGAAVSTGLGVASAVGRVGVSSGEESSGAGSV